MPKIVLPHKPNLKEIGFKVHSEVPNQVEEDGWEVYGKNVTEKTATKDNVNPNSIPPGNFFIRHVIMFDEVLGEVCGTDISEVPRFQVEKVI